MLPPDNYEEKIGFYLFFRSDIKAIIIFCDAAFNAIFCRLGILAIMSSESEWRKRLNIIVQTKGRAKRYCSGSFNLIC